MMEAYKLNFKYEKPFRISKRIFTHSSGVMLFEKREKLVGYGEAAPNPAIMHDTQEDVFDYLRKNSGLLPKIINSESIRQMHKKLPAGSVTARASMDFALHDLWGKQTKNEVAKLYSKKKNIIPNCFTIFGKNPEETKLDVERVLTKYPSLGVLKIKLMGKGDVQRCRAVKEKADEMRKKISFALDCNQGYKTASEAIKSLNEIKDVLKKIVLVEEPVAAKKWGLLKEVSDNADIPVFADESAVNLEDVKTIISRDCAKGINLKLQKIGGILPAKVVADECRKYGLKVMVGCMFETAVGISAGIHFAQSTKNVVLTDLDADLQLPDIYKFGPKFENGVRKTSGKPGLGVELDFAKIKKLEKSSNAVYEKII
ncbi:MAG TPA: enolase C-terminal domain-like protein [Candidatus Nanoarchaeia archaeon]|nr:enolase C-terminal domain-like protein [Candidatus Nanoarchaeia archaeon]